MRRFKPSDPNKDTGDFDKLLGEIFPQEVPIGFVKGVRVIYNNGDHKDLTNEEIMGVSPNVGEEKYQKRPEKKRTKSIHNPRLQEK